MRRLIATLFLSGCMLWSPIDAVELCLQRELRLIEDLPEQEYQREYNKILDRYEPVFDAYRSGSYYQYEQALEEWGGCPVSLN